MHVGIDFGTTRTVVATVDRGNYPVVPMIDTNGDYQDFLPSVVALADGELVAGWRALTADYSARSRSFKRLLADPAVTGHSPVHLGEHTRPVAEVLVAHAREIAAQLHRFQASLGDDSAIEAVIGVPANATSAQRLVTIDAFLRAGIGVLGLVNEPSAAAFEFTHRHPRRLNSKRSSIVVYDLGGGTFDTSLIAIDGSRHEVVASRGIARLGGDDFDELLLALATHSTPDDLLALEEAREAKERIKPQSRRVVLELAGTDVVVPVADFYAAVRPLVERTMTAMSEVIGHGSSLQDTDIAGIYLVGGSSALPIVPRILRERYAHRVHRSPLPGASTAVGLAIAADPESPLSLRDRTARGIGVFRERDSGEGVVFDPLVSLDTPPDEDGVIRVTRRYRAAHNVGVFRFVEFTELSPDGEPGDVSLLREVVVPFDSAVAYSPDLQSVTVERRDDGPEVIERVRVSPEGIAKVSIEVPELGRVVT